MRRAALLVLGLAAALAGCSTLDKLNPFSGGPAKPKLAELPPLKPTAELALQWQASAGAAGDYVFVPAVVGSTVYAAGRDGSLARFDQGRQAWRISASPSLSGGVGADERLVAVGTSKGEVLAFDTAGKELWKARVTSEVLAAPLPSGDKVIVRSGDNRIFALDAKDGKRRWVYQRNTPPLTLRSHVGVTLTDRAVLAGFPGGKLVAINPANGAPLWEATVALPRGATELERVADVTSPPVVNGSEVCAAAYQGRVACFDLGNGNTLWAKDMSSSAGLDADARHVYAADDRGVVHALSKSNGASVWRNDKLVERGVTRPLVLGGLVAVADAQGFVHLLRADDGAFAARSSTDGSPVAGEPRPLGAGFVVQTRNGGLFAFGAR